MNSVGLRELRQDASQVIRRVEAGEEIEVTIQGRPAARIVPISSRQERVRSLPWSEVKKRLVGMEPDTTGWAEELRAMRDNDPFVDPWERAGR
jgi:prevent-host-death family protein